MARYQERAQISVEQAERLESWIYLDEYGSKEEREYLRRIECARAPGVHLIGRDLMFALCQAEYLVFMATGRLRPKTAAKFGKLRLVRRSGAGAGPSGSVVETVGYGQPGLEGYRAAVEHVYAMFALPAERAAVEFDDTTPPNFSLALSKTPASIREYAGELWDLSTKHSESTFNALYFFYDCLGHGGW